MLSMKISSVTIFFVILYQVIMIYKQIEHVMIPWEPHSIFIVFLDSLRDAPCYITFLYQSIISQSYTNSIRTLCI